MRRPLAVELDLVREELARVKAELAEVVARLKAVPSRRRPRYAPWKRLKILWHGARYGLSVSKLARAFVVAPQTILRWRKDLMEGKRRLVASRAPMNKLADVISEIACHLKWEQPSWGTHRIAGILAKLGLAGSRTSVQRILRRKPPRRAAVVRRTCATAKKSVLQARYPGHLYYADFTKLSAFMGLFSVTIGAVIDGFSRRVLSISAWRGEPSACDARALMRRAFRAAAPSTS